MNILLLRRLRCPLCGSKFDASGIDAITGAVEYGLLTCACSRYPVVAGIPVLDKGNSGVINEAIAFIEGDRHREALLMLLSPPNPLPLPAWIQRLPMPYTMLQWLRTATHQWGVRHWRKRAGLLVGGRAGQVTACDLFDLYFHNNEANNYFAFRFGQPRHLVALSFAGIIEHPKSFILDLACGCGHITRSLVQQAAGQQVIGCDAFFFGLYIAKHWIAPDAEYVCCSADAPLPFSDGAASAVFCSDAFHYFADKGYIIRELKRVVQTGGLIILTWMHNALLRTPHDGLPLLPEGYRMLLDDMPHCMVSDRDVLSRYLQKKGPHLAHSADSGHLAAAPLLSVVASHRGDVFRDYGTFDEWPHARGRLGLNPLYVEEGRDGKGNVHLRRTLPSAFYEQDNAECKDYLPATVEVHDGIMEHLMRGRRSPEMEKLIQQCVVLGVPERYR